MFFASDNTGPVHPRVMEALAEANAGHMPSYGSDDLTRQAEDRIREIFEAPEAAVYLVATGTTANALALACLTRPWDTVFCTPEAHVQVDECNAPEFYTGGAKLTLVGEADRMTPAALDAAMTHHGSGDVHIAQSGPVSLTQVTENGRLYALDELRALTEVAKRHANPVHLDGARFANAIAALGCTPAEMTWRAGVDVVSFGGTKNGLMGAEAVVLFDPAKAREFELRRKRGAHLYSKHRYLAAQMLAYLDDGLWLEMAAAANANTARLAEGLRGCSEAALLYEVQANMIFCTLPRGLHRKLHAAGARYTLFGSLDGPEDEAVRARFVCDWSVSKTDIDRFTGLLGA
ncbi:threonine aldolase family protein [Marinovum algicola]|jgi:threonine aldolase|uniref:threonine aldolase family protein n=1 Tax=Marinovum TaxID=367771 RepID=UPI00065B0D95|nr:beta-eliminating lyase-related protein [Marinovum algicola]AKO95397.1 Threonine aldolase [Marinovum algicola DG 898]